MTMLYMVFLGTVLLVLAVAVWCWRHDREVEWARAIGYAHRQHEERGLREVGDG